MKVGVAFYYKDLEQYPVAWVKQSVDSIAAQTFNEFNIYVLDYGEKRSLLSQTWFNPITHWHKEIGYCHKPLSNYADAMNEIYEWIFEDSDVAVNTNIDDYYAPNRIELLLKELEKGADIASANMMIVHKDGRILANRDHSKVDIYKELKSNYNPVSNPCHVMKKRVFDKLKFDSSLVPIEDMTYWKKAIELGFKIVINPAYLHYYRMHPGQSSNRH